MRSITYMCRSAMHNFHVQMNPKRHGALMPSDVFYCNKKRMINGQVVCYFFVEMKVAIFNRGNAFGLY